MAVGATGVWIQGINVAVPEQLEAASKVLFGIRPERVSLSAEGNLRGEVMAVEYLGSHQIVTVQTKAGTVRARVGKDLSVRLGETLGLTFDVGHSLLYDAQSEWILASAQTKRLGVEAGKNLKLEVVYG